MKGNVLARILLISTYEMGRQPFGLASPAAWLARDGHIVRCVDTAIEQLPAQALAEADLIGFHLPMHTATRMAAPLIGLARRASPAAQIVCYGLYAPLNAAYLKGLGADFVLGGEFEADLLRIANGREPELGLPKLAFVTPERQGLAPLERYAHLMVNGESRMVGYTEATRGCKHKCRHCPVVPVYDGAFRVVPVDVVLADVRQQVEKGAQHITFGDPDFWNGPAHARRIVEAMHAEFPGLTYDVTIKIEHLLKHTRELEAIRRTGCLFITSAVESLDDHVLALLEKGHTRADFVEAAHRLREEGLVLAPTFIAFTPWTTRESYGELLETLRELDLVANTSPVQLALRLLIPAGSRLLELDEIRAVLESGFDAAALLHRWRHPDSAIDELAREAMALVAREQKAKRSRTEIFAKLWELTFYRAPVGLTDRTSIPYLNEPWYC